MLTLNGHDVEVEEYPNGEARIDIPTSWVLGRANQVVFRYRSDADLLHLAMLAHHIGANHDPASQLVLAYMPYSRMDRVKEKHQVFTLKVVSDFINRLGFDSIKVVEPHSDVTCALLDADPIWAVEALLPRVKEQMEFFEAWDYIVFPDAGAAKRYDHLAQGHHVLVGNKHRDFNTGQITKLELVGDPPDPKHWPDALIIDDLCSFGGTFIRCAQALKGKGFDQVHLLVAHKEQVDALTEAKLFEHVDHLHTTDSIHPYPYAHQRMTIHPLGEIL